MTLHTFTAYTSSVPLFSPSITLPKLPLPNTLMKWKSSSPIFLSRPLLSFGSEIELGVRPITNRCLELATRQQVHLIIY